MKSELGNSAWIVPLGPMTNIRSKSLNLPKNWKVSSLLKFQLFHYPWITSLLTLLRLIELDAELNALKAMVDNVVPFFYPGESSSATRTPQVLDSLSNHSWEIVLANMQQPASLTLGILKSLYPQADLDAAGEGFTTTCSDEEALKLVEDSVVTSRQIGDMLDVDMSLGWESFLDALSTFLHVIESSWMEIIFALLRYATRKFQTHLIMNYLLSFAILNLLLLQMKDDISP
jgi:hypothetical protein